MQCSIVKDLIPLYIDDCCSNDSKRSVETHIECCASCKSFLKDMKTPSIIPLIPKAPVAMRRLNNWKASILQSVLLFLSFAIITIGVSLEAKTPSGPMNGYWSMNLIIPGTGFLLSLTNWYFVQLYKNKTYFSNCSALATLGITVCGYIWAVFHYELRFFSRSAMDDFVHLADILQRILLLNGIGMIATAVFCILSKTLSNQFAKMLGKE